MDTNSMNSLRLFTVMLCFTLTLTAGCAGKSPAFMDGIFSNAQAPASGENTSPKSLKLKPLPEKGSGAGELSGPVGPPDMASPGIPGDHPVDMTGPAGGPMTGGPEGPPVLIPEPLPKEPPAETSTDYSPQRLSRNGSAGVEAVKSSETGGELTFNFDDADLYEVVRIMAEMLRMNYIVDPSVKGKVTIHTAGGLSASDLLPVFHQILELNGLAAVAEGNLVKIVKIDTVNRMPLTPLSGGGRIFQLIPLKYMAAEEASKLISPFLSEGGSVTVNTSGNTLIVVDREIAMKKLIDLVRTFDIDMFDNMQHRFYRLKNIQAEDAEKILQGVMAGQGAKDVYSFIPITRINTLLVTCKKPRDFKRIDMLMERIDEYNDLAEPQIYVYKVRNGAADELSSLLNTVFTKTKKEDKKTIDVLKDNAEKKTEDESSKKVELFPSKEVKKTAQTTPGSVTEGTSGTLQGDVKITPDTIRNALIIEAYPSDYRIITRILDHIDILPRQVLIEVVIAEISLDDTTQFGVDWTLKSASTDGKGDFSGTVGSDGFNLSVGVSNKVSTAILASATNKDINVISTPRILASDNKEANINITTKTPVGTTSYTTSDSNDGVFETDIQYKDTGVILSVTPRINDRGLVSMDISQEVSEEGDVPGSVGGNDYPTFKERSVTTSLTVADGQTIVIGGLMRETDNKSKDGVPFLSRLPLFGVLFGKHATSTEKSELIILITPTVIKSLDDVDYVTREFQERVVNAMLPQGGKSQLKQ